MTADFDSPWKEALDLYFEAFLLFLFSGIHSRIDWSRGYESLDKEFQQIVREAEVGRRYVDKLVKVWTKDGVETWVLIHVEVQTTRDADFPLRMYIYNYRIFDRYNKPVASIAVLADEDDKWRPTEHYAEQFGCESILRFPTVKLLDFAGREDELEASLNPFAKVVLAHLKACETKNDVHARHTWKLRLIRGLYERGFGAKDVRELFRLIDWLMELPPPLSDVFKQEVNEIQEEKRMPYVTSIERLGRCDGMREGIEIMLEKQFGEEGLALMPEIRAIYEEDKLREIMRSLKTACSVEDVRQVCLKQAQN
jgi:hypothetical protein